MATRHPETADLLRHLLADPGVPGDRSVTRHVAGCEACQAAVAQLRETVNALRLSAPQSDAATAACLDEDWIAAFAEGSVEPAESSTQVAHLLDCARCASQVASVARLLDDAAVADEVERLTSRRPVVRAALRARRRGVIGTLGGIAAAAALVVLMGRSDAPSDRAPDRSVPSVREPNFREPSVSGAIPPAPLAPVGDVRAADSLRWTSVVRANRYRLTIFDRDGSVVWETQTPDTVIALPPQLGRPVGTTYLWRVEARAGWEDRWVASDLTEFTVRAAPPRR